MFGHKSTCCKPFWTIFGHMKALGFPELPVKLRDFNSRNLSGKIKISTSIFKGWPPITSADASAISYQVLSTAFSIWSSGAITKNASWITAPAGMLFWASLMAAELIISDPEVCIDQFCNRLKLGPSFLPSASTSSERTWYCQPCGATIFYKELIWNLRKRVMKRCTNHLRPWKWIPRPLKKWESRYRDGEPT